MIKKKIKDLIKVKYYKKILKKNEIKKNILKSIIQNKNIEPKIRFIAKINILHIKKINSFNKNKRICLLVGRKSGFINKLNLCRHQIKYIASKNELLNMNIRT